jgi:hypothetical protein
MKIAVRSEELTERKIIFIQNPKPLNVSADGTQACSKPPY